MSASLSLSGNVPDERQSLKQNVRENEQVRIVSVVERSAEHEDEVELEGSQKGKTPNTREHLGIEYLHKKGEKFYLLVRPDAHIRLAQYF